MTASNRRVFLKGLGTLALGLPLLEYTHGAAWAQGLTAAKRFIVVFEHGGTISNQGRSGGGPTRDFGWRSDGSDTLHGWDDWRPLSTTEALTQLGPIHAPSLDPFKAKLLVLSGIDNVTCVKQEMYWGGHGSSNASVLTANRYYMPDPDTHLGEGPSIDEVVAQRLVKTQPVPFTSVHLQVPGHQYGSPFFKAARQRVSSESKPDVAFQSLFAGVSTSGPDPALVKARLMKKSVLDGTLDGLAKLRTKVSTADRAVIDAHLEHVRELETRLGALQMPVSCARPTGITTTTASQKIGELMADLIVAAMRCGLTNVATLDIADLITSWLPTPYGPVAYDIGHSLDHEAGEIGAKGAKSAKAAQWRDEMQINRRWRMSLVARIVAGLDATPEGGKTMLDNSLLLETSEFSCGVEHSVKNLPTLLAGSAGGYFRTGRHLDFNAAPAGSDYRSNKSNHNLFTSILQAFGQPDVHFGSDDAWYKGPLPNLT
ncbi:MAG: DUF1552 domain-containing protein [Archangiaceae bacterium]|nr:DUF1552 domain-containing protein [Archangiaceae bacterium]